jgi:hypothetical protein
MAGRFVIIGYDASRSEAGTSDSKFIIIILYPSIPVLLYNSNRTRMPPAQTAATEQTALLPPHSPAGETLLFEDVVTLNYKNIGYVWLQCSFVWLIGFTLCVVQQQTEPHTHTHTHTGAPTWIGMIGTLGGAAGCGIVLYKLLSHSTIILDNSMHRMQAAGVNVSRTHIAVSSFPLMRLLLFLVGISLGMLVCIFISEVCIIVLQLLAII